MNLEILLLFVLAYFLGSIPFGKIVGLHYGIDIQKEGSGNIGFANSWRVLGLKKAAFVLILDVLKGYACIILFRGYLNSTQLPILALVPILGHIFPVWLKFHGGKGVATSLGVVLALSPLLSLIGIIVWVLVVIATKRPAIASLSMMLIMLASSFYVADNLSLLLATIFIIVVATHHKNISNLLHGREPKISWNF